MPDDIRMADAGKVSRYLLAVPRIFVGYHFLMVGWPKVSPAFLTGERLTRQLTEGLAADPLAVHRAFISGWVIPNAQLFSYIVAFGEVAIGLSLLAGCLVRISSVFGAFHNLNIYLALSFTAGGAQQALNRLYVVLHLAFVIGAAGRALGLDGWLKKRYPRAWWF